MAIKMTETRIKDRINSLKTNLEENGKLISKWERKLRKISK